MRAAAQRYVVTEPGRGYRFVAHVATRDAHAAASAAEPNRLYARGRYCFEQRTAAALERSIAYFRRAIDADPRFGRAHAGLASAYALCGEYLLRAPDDAFPAADAAARRALRLDAASAEACIALGDVACFYERDLASADRLYRQAHALAPAASNTSAFRAWFLCVAGRAAEAAELLDAAIAREPYSLLLQTTRAVASIFRREYGDAIAQLRAVLELDAEYVHARYYLAMALHLGGAHAQAALVCAGPMPDGYEQQLLALRGASLARLGKPRRGARGARRDPRARAPRPLRLVVQRRVRAARPRRAPTPRSRRSSAGSRRAIRGWSSSRSTRSSTRCAANARFRALADDVAVRRAR